MTAYTYIQRVPDELLEDFHQRELAWYEQRRIFNEQLDAGQEVSFQQLQYSFQQLQSSFELLQQSYHQIKQVDPISQTPFQAFLKSFRDFQLFLAPPIRVREQVL